MIERICWSKPEDIQKLLVSLQQDYLFIGSTDTVIGLMGNVDERVLKKIDNVKNRQRKPYIILVDSIRKAKALSSIKNFHIEKFLRLCWPGAVTVILNKKRDVPDYIGSVAKVALRIPDHEGLKELLSQLPYGLYSTSANVSSDPVPATIQGVSQRIIDACHYYVDNGMQNGLPSTIIDCSEDTLRVVRPGAFPIERLQQLYHQAAD